MQVDAERKNFHFGKIWAHQYLTKNSRTSRGVKSVVKFSRNGPPAGTAFRNLSGVPLPETAVPPPKVVVPPPGDAVLYFLVS